MTDVSVSEQEYQKINEAYVTASVMSLRLDTRHILDNIEAYLRGAKSEYYEDTKTGEVKARFVKIGRQLMNEQGVQRVMGWLQSLLGPHTVQGYFPDDKSQKEFVRDAKIDFIGDLMTNLPEWEVNDEDYKGIIATIWNQLDRYFSRSVGDRERGSYAKSLQTSQKQTVGGGGIAGFLGGNKGGGA